MNMKASTSLQSSQSSNNDNEKSIIFRLASKALKYYLLMLFGCAVSFVLAGILGVLPIVKPSLPAVGGLLWRSAMIVLCFGAIAVVFESIRQ